MKTILLRRLIFRYWLKCFNWNKNSFLMPLMTIIFPFNQAGFPGSGQRSSFPSLPLLWIKAKASASKGQSLTQETSRPEPVSTISVFSFFSLPFVLSLLCCGIGAPFQRITTKVGPFVFSSVHFTAMYMNLESRVDIYFFEGIKNPWPKVRIHPSINIWYAYVCQSILSQCLKCLWNSKILPLLHF